MTKLVIQIPCYNEAEQLPAVVASLPRSLPGVAVIEWVVVDDGSSDATAEVAKHLGVHHVVRLPRHQGLARAFVVALETSIKVGADIVVNTDGDNQYRADDIPRLIAPILDGQAEVVIGARPVRENREFSLSKRLLQRMGSWMTRVVSNTQVEDAPSGFRAFSRQAAMQLHVFNDYTYTIETIIQAGRKGMAITSVPIRVNPRTRDSRLIRGVSSYLIRQILTMVRIGMTYRPFRFFVIPATILFTCGFLIALRFLYFYMTDGGQGHVQSLILAALLMGMGGFLGVVGLLADLIAVNRALLERLEGRLRVLEDSLDRAQDWRQTP